MGNKFREKPVEERQENVDLAAQSAKQESPKVEKPLDIQDDAQGDVATEPVKIGKGGKAARGLGRVLGGDMLADRYVLRQIPLVLLCLIYLLLIVGNRYRVESLSREKMATEERINDLREERIQMQKQYQRSVKISQIAEELAETGVGITSGPPYEL